MPVSKPAMIVTLCKCLGSRGAITFLYGMGPTLGEETLWEALCKADLNRAAGLPQLHGNMDFDGLIKSLHGDELTSCVVERKEEDNDELERCCETREVKEIDEDVTVVVAEELECKLPSACLRCASIYFDEMLSDLPEGELKKTTIAFPSKTKAQWDIVLPFLDLRVAQKPSLSHGDAGMLLQWNDELGIKNKSFIPMCDSIIFKSLRRVVKWSWSDSLRRKRAWVECKQIDELFLTSMKVAHRYDLPKSKLQSIETLFNCTGAEVATTLLHGMRPILGDWRLGEILCLMDSKVTVQPETLACKEQIDFTAWPILNWVPRPIARTGRAVIPCGFRC